MLKNEEKIRKTQENEKTKEKMRTNVRRNEENLNKKSNN